MSKFKINMFMESQKACEILEKLLEKDTQKSVLTKDEFFAINEVLFRMTANDEYKTEKQTIN